MHLWLSFILLLLLCFSFNGVSGARHRKHHRSDAVVVGTVYCDTCFQQEASKSTHFISGATVAVECGGDGLKSFRQEAKTNEKGEFEAKLPVSISKHVDKIKMCSVKLVSSSEPYCAVAATATSSEIRFKSKKASGTHVFSAGFFTFKPELCSQKDFVGKGFPPALPDPATPFLPPVGEGVLPPLPVPELPVPSLVPPVPGVPGIPIPPVPPVVPPVPGVPGLPIPPVPPLVPPVPGVPGIPIPPVPPLVPPVPGVPGIPIPPVSGKKTESDNVSDQKIFGFPFPPTPLDPPMLPPLPLVPSPPSVIPPLPFQPSPPSLIPPLIPSPPPASMFPPLPFPPLPFPPLPGVIPSPPPPPPPSFPIPLPPLPPVPRLPIPPVPGIPIPPASNPHHLRKTTP